MANMFDAGAHEDSALTLLPDKPEPATAYALLAIAAAINDLAAAVRELANRD